MAYLNSTASSDYLTISYGSFYHHNSVVQTSLYLLNELIRTTTKKQRASFRLGAVLEDVVPFPTNLSFLELSARTQMLTRDIGAR